MKSAPFIMDFFNYPGADSNDPLSINAMFENFDQDVSDELEELLQCTVTEKLGAHFGLRTPPAATDFALANSPTHNIAMCGSLNNNNNNIKLNNNNLTSTTGSSNNKTANNEFMANGFASGLNATNASLADANNSHAQPMYNNATTISVTNTTATGNILRGVDIAGLLQLTEDHRSNVWTANVSEQTVPRTTSVSTPTLTAISDLAVDSRIRNRTSLGSLTSNTNGNIHVNGSNPRVFVDHLKETENANPNLQVNQRPGLAVSRHHGRDQPVNKQCTAVLLGTVGQLSKNGLMQGAQHHSINSPLNSGLHSHNNNSRGQPSPSQQHQNENTATTTLSPIFLLQSCPQQTHLQQQQQQQQRILQESEQIKQQGIMGNIYQHSQNILQNIAIQPMETSDFSCETNEGPQRTLGHHRTTLHPTVDTSALADTLTCEDLLREGQMGDKNYPKPVYSYSCLIAMALKNSKAGSLPVSEIYNFMIENFPYFKNAPGGWKNSVRHNLSLNKCFEKVDNPKLAGTSRKGCLWALNPAKIPKMEEEIAKWEKKDPQGIRNSMAKPERLEMIVQGRACSRHISHELTNIIVSSTNNRIEHPGALTTTVNHLDIKSSILSNLQNNDYSHHHNQQQQQQQQQHLEMMESSQHQHLNQHHNHHQLTPSKIEEMLGISLKDVNTLETRNFTLDSELALKGSLWDEDLNLELSVDIPLSSVSTNGSLQSLNTLATSAPHINLYSPLTGIRTDSLMSTGFGHTAYG